MTRPGQSLLVLGLMVAASATARSQGPPLDEYFRAETAKIEARPLDGIASAEAWKRARPELQRRLREMLGLDPLPEKTPLNVTITGTLERPEFVVDRLHYQASPGLFVTANLFRPKASTGRLPAILYVCGHGREEKDGVIFGNKTHYNHHGAWFAANGYVCLVVDTLQLGELPGLHNATVNNGMWWWYSRGYTPAGIEAWTGIRGIDYLLSRVDVDPARIGVTGRSGGGATSWWLAAIDDRIAAVAPVAGITDLENHVVDGAVQGHCECMYFVNTYRWDYTMVAALAAPKPMLVQNTSRDTIFPEDGVRRVFKATETVYDWYGAGDKLSLQIGDGPHMDSVELRHAAFAFFERWLKGDQGASPSSISEPDRKLPFPTLKVLAQGESPPGVRNAEIHEAFVPKAAELPVPTDESAWAALRKSWLDTIRTKTFGGWPSEGEAVPLDLRVTARRSDESGTMRVLTFASQAGIRPTLVILEPKGRAAPRPFRLIVADDELAEALGDPKTLTPSKLRDRIAEGRDRPPEDLAIAIVLTRGMGDDRWPKAKDTHLRRRFYLLGQTLDGMRVWDVRRAISALKSAAEGRVESIELLGRRPMAAVALWATAFEPGVDSLTMIEPPPTVRDGPAFLNLEKVLDMPQAVALVLPRGLKIQGESGARDASLRAWSDKLPGRNEYRPPTRP